jgi:hypothetical protein
MATLVVSLLVVSQALVGPGFVLIGEERGVEVYLRKQDPRVIELAGVGEFEAPPEEVQAALLDCEKQQHHVETIAECRVLERKPGEVILYQRLDLPVIKDRDFALRVIWNSTGSTRGVRYSVVAGKGPPPNDDAVRVSLMTGRWVLEPIGDGTRTRATYHVQVDLAGLIPPALVRSGAGKDIPGLFEGMRKVVLERRTMR